MKKEGLDVLLIQDDAEGNEQIERVLKGYYPNVYIEIGTTGRECLDYLREREFDVLLLGHRLLDSPGLDILGAVTSNQNGPPVIVVVGPSEVWAALSAMKAGASDYIVQSGEHLLTLPFVIQRTVNYHRSLKEVDQLRLSLRKAGQRPGADREESEPTREDLGIVDRLTQIYNQRYFEMRLTEEFHRAKRYMYPISLLVIDIDNLILFGDSRQRDQILSGVGRLVSGGVRRTDLVARRVETDLGMLLLYSDINGGRGVAERIRRRVEENVVDEQHGRKSVTISIGVSSLSPGDSQTDAFVASADRALYTAKVKGGNQIALVESS